jgi:hypothetical protein
LLALSAIACGDGELRSRSSGEVQPKQKTPALLRQGFFFVAETGEISNLELLEDILKILEFLDSVNTVY